MNTNKELFSKMTNKEYSGHKKKVYTLGWSLHGSKLASGSADNNIRIWNYDSFNFDKGYELKSHTDSVHQLLWSPVDENSIMSFSSDKTMKLWDIRSSKTTRSERIKGGCSNVTWSCDGNIICYSNKDEDLLTVYDCRKSTIMKQIDFKYQASEFQFEKGGNCLLVSSSLGEIHIYDAKTFNSTPLATVVAHFAPINSIHIEPSNKYFATAAADSLICLWDLQEMISYKVMKKGESSIKKILYSYDSKFIASISDENNIDIFEIDTAECINTIVCKYPQNALAWHPNSWVLAYCGDEKNRNNADEGSIHLFGTA